MAQTMLFICPYQNRIFVYLPIHNYKGLMNPHLKSDFSQKKKKINPMLAAVSYPYLYKTSPELVFNGLYPKLILSNTYSPCKA